MHEIVRGEFESYNSHYLELNEGNLQAGGVVPRSVPVNSLQQGINAWITLNFLNMSGQEASFVRLLT